MNLYWLPVSPKRGKGLPDKLKFVLRERFEYPVRVEFDEHTIGYLQGLHDAGVEGAEELIEAIEKHGRIQVFESE